MSHIYDQLFSHGFFATFLEGACQHAPVFSLSSDPQVNEAEVALVLSEKLSKQGKKTFHSIVPRRQPNDPPDCEAIGPWWRQSLNRYLTLSMSDQWLAPEISVKPVIPGTTCWE